MEKPTPTIPNLPLRPPTPASDDDEAAAPPRKRPRTHATVRAAPSVPSSTQPEPVPSSVPVPVPTPASVPAPAPTTVVTEIPGTQLHRFPIQPLHRFQGPSASIKRPREVAHFSYDDNHEYRDDDSSISYYHPPDIGADMKEGFDTFRHYEDTSDPHLDSLLKSLMRKEKKDGRKERVDFVTWRGMMTKIMTAPFDMFAEFSMFATLRDGTIYIEEDFPARAAQRAAEASRPPPRFQAPDQPDHKMMTYWGYKFEVLSLLPTPPPDTPEHVVRERAKAPVSNHAQHCSIIRTSFGPHSLLLGGEVDGLSGPKPAPDSDQPIPWIELKTAEELPPRPSHRDLLKFERKLLKFWAQSFLLGVPTVIVGYRSKQGILRGVQQIETARIPGMVRRGTNCWDGNVCINFAAAFLAHLKDVVKGNGVYRIELQKKAGVIEVQEVSSDGGGEIVSNEFRAWRQELDAGDTEERVEA